MSMEGNMTTPAEGEGGSGNETVPSANSTELRDNWQNLDFPWTELLANATANSDMSTWDKATYKYWI